MDNSRSVFERAKELFLLGLDSADIEEYENAEKFFLESLNLMPGRASTLTNLSAVQINLNKLDRARERAFEAIALDESNPDAWVNLGIICHKEKAYHEALTHFDKAIRYQPNNAEVHINRGNTLKELDRLVEALASHDRALTLEPNYAEAYKNRGNVLTELKRPDEALASYYRALALKPDQEFLAGTVLHLRMKLCQWEGFTEEIEGLVKGVQEAKPVTQPFELLSLTDSPELHRRASQIYADRRFKKQDALGPIVKRVPDGKIRIGYYSADFHNHATAYLITELFEKRDTSRFQLFGFSFGPETKDEMRRRLTAAFDQFIDVREMSDRDVAKLSRELGIDIAVDLKGYTTDARTGIFAERAAPIQVNYLGYPSTMGVDYIDYIIADKTIIPVEQQANYSEEVVYLPHSYQVNDSRRRISDRQFTKEELGLAEKGFVFCCFNNNYKILPTTFDGWMRILQTVEGSVLWLLEDNATAAANLRKEAERRGVENSRLVFARRMPLDEHLARHRHADLFIDTLPCNAHTTASDALWAGLPVLTCTGQSFASRVAASLLNAIDMPELITSTQEEYEAKAIDLATHPDKLRAIKNRLEQNRLTTPLFDTKLFARHIEAAYEAMYDRYQAGG